MRGNWIDEARRFEDIDRAILARLEAEDAVKYHAKHGRLPELLSERARRYLEQQDGIMADQVDSIDKRNAAVMKLEADYKKLLKQNEKLRKALRDCLEEYHRRTWTDPVQGPGAKARALLLELGEGS